MAKHRKQMATDDFSELTDEELRQHASAAQQEFYRREKAKSVQNTLVVDDTAEPDEEDPVAKAIAKSEGMSQYDDADLIRELDQRGVTVYPSSIVLGAKYRDKRHGIVGYAVAITFSENSCTRVTIEYRDGQKLEMVGMDDVELEEMNGTPVEGTGKKPGGVKDLDLTREAVDPAFTRAH